MKPGSIEHQRHIQKSLGVIAGPLGFYGRTSGTVVIGALRETRQEALEDATTAQVWIDADPTSAPHAWRVIN